jgi:GT2 family glycosyltransferase
MASHPHAGAAGGKLVNPDGSFQLACARRPPNALDYLFLASRLAHLFPQSKIFHRNWYPDWDRNDTRQVEVISGAFFVVRRDVLDEIGLFDEDFFFLGEDIDLCIRVRRSGWQIWYVHDVEILHYGGQSSRQVSIEASILSIRATQTYLKKYFNSFDVYIYLVGMWILCLLKAISYTILSLLKPQKRKKAHHYFELCKWISTARDVQPLS